MRVVYLFVSKGSAPYKSKPSWNAKKVINDASIMTPNGLQSEGTFYMLDRMQELGFIDELLIVIESSKDPGRAVYGRHAGIHVPELSELSQFIKKDDVIFVRGGWRGWWEWLNDRQGKHWLINYAANTGRQRWKFWDVVLWDLEDIFTIDRLNRLWLPFRKPTNPYIFKELDLPFKYDLCIGASFIHDKKGQFRSLRVLDEYERLYGKKLRCIMPGALRTSTHTQEIIDNASKYNIEMPGMLERKELAKVMNQSKIGLFLGSSGQNDRGPLEAMQCGCYLIIGSPKYHSPVVYSNKYIQWVPKSLDDYEGIAKKIHERLQYNIPLVKECVIEWNKNVAHVDTVTIPYIGSMFAYMRENPKPDARKLYDAIR